MNPPTTKSASWAQAWLTGRESSAPGLSMLTSAYKQSSWVYACITTLAESVSAIPLRFVDKNGNPDTSAFTLQLSTLFDNPHPQLDRFQFWELIVIWLCLRGEAFIYPNLDGRVTRVPNSLSILSPDCLHEIIRNGELAGWRYSGCSTSDLRSPTSILLPEELIHIKLPNPFNVFRGLSPLTVAWLAAQTDYAASQFMKGTMLNNADTGLIVITDNQPTAEQKEEMLALLRDRKRRAGTPDIPLFLWGGAKVEKPTISAVDLQFLENRKFNRQEICAIFKVPQELIGFTEDANRSVSDAMRLNFMENRVAPLCRRLEAAIQPLIDRLTGAHNRNHTLTPNLYHSSTNAPGGTSYTSPTSSFIKAQFHLASTPIMQSAQRARFETATKLFSMGIPLNIINKNLDLGLPKLPHGDKVYLPTKLQEVGSVLPDDPAPEEPQHEDATSRCLRLLPLLNFTSRVGTARCAARPENAPVNGKERH